MPIRPEMRRRYPPREEWQSICSRIRTRATGADGVVRCEDCRKPDGELVHTVWDGSGRWQPAEAELWDWFGPDGEPCDQPKGVEIRSARVRLATTHNNHQPEENGDDNLRLRCQGCHLRHDRTVHQHRRGQTLRYPVRQPALAIGPVPVVLPQGVPER